MLAEEGEACWGEADDVAAVRCGEGDEAAVVGVFPHREFGAGRAPGIHRLFVGPVASCEPFKEIEDEILDDDVGHFGFRPSIIYMGIAGRDENAISERRRVVSDVISFVKLPALWERGHDEKGLLGGFV